MRQKHLKFHAAALVIICGLIFVLYTFLGPKEPGPVEELVGDRFVQIDNATWGQNCDPFVDQALAQWRVPAKGEEATARPARALYNNALKTMTDHCNGRLDCKVLAESTTFGIEPLESCYKRLVVGYRCFAFDRLWTVDIGQGELLSLDCHEKPGSTEPSTKHPHR